MPPSPPVPIAAVWLTGPDRVEVTFDRPLQPGAVAFANWRTRRVNFRYLGVPPAAVVGSVLTCSQISNIPSIGPQSVDYLATPPDIISTKGIPAAPFTNFPMS